MIDSSQPGAPEAVASPSARAVAALGVVSAAAFSVLRKGYQFDGYFADDQFWNTLLVDRMHPGLLANDPLVQLIGDRYESGLFDVMELLAAVAPLHVLSFAFFLLARLLVCAAMYRLAHTFTGSRAAAMTATFLMAGASVSYLGGVNFVETILTPRGLALAFGLFGLDAFLRGNARAMTLWFVACLVVHPISGVNFVGVALFCGWLFPSTLPRGPFFAAQAALAATMLAVAAWTGQFGGDAGGLRFDDDWAAIITETVGPWVYLRQTPGAVWMTSLWVPAFGALAVALVGTGRVRVTFRRLALASAAALLLHLVAVDWMNLRPALQLSPQRATVCFAAISLGAVGLWIVESMRAPDPLRRSLAAAFFFAAVLLRDPAIAALFALLLALAWVLRDAALSGAARGALGAVAVIAVLLLVSPWLADSFHFDRERSVGRMARLRNLGVDEEWAAVQRYIRQHSRTGDVVMAPPALSPRVFAQRPSALREKMKSFTHVSRPFAFAYEAWREDVGAPMEAAGAARAMALARGTGAAWLVLDDRQHPPAPGDPDPAQRVGPYRAFELQPTGKRPAGSISGQRSAEPAE